MFEKNSAGSKSESGSDHNGPPGSGSGNDWHKDVVNRLAFAAVPE